MNTAAIWRGLKKAAPTIVTIVTVAGVCATAYFSAKAGSDAKQAIIEEEAAQKKELELVEKVKLVAPFYIPAGCVLAATLGSIALGRVVDKKRRAELSAMGLAAYRALEQKYKKYQDVVKQEYGEDAHAKILTRMDIPEAEQVSVHGECLGEANCGGPFGFDEEIKTFYDSYSGQYFKASVGQVMRAEFHLNRNFTLAGDACLSDWYEFLGIPAPEGADEKYWTVEDELYFIDFQHYKTTLDDGFECGVIEFAWDPYPNPYETIN